MAKLNKKKKRRTSTVTQRQLLHPTQTENVEGGVAFKLSPKLKLYNMVATCFWKEPRFYKREKDGVTIKDVDKQMVKLIRAVARVDPEFVLKLAVYARGHDLNLRTVPQVILAECSLIKEAKPFIRRYTPHIIQRADELTAAIAYLQNRFGNIGDSRQYIAQLAQKQEIEA